ncbi:hypothetical protein [Streptomyces sp. NPDC013455]|uniref:hypothetical protein n=1 Tax=Streptomyces sp. NPDC013455 TaxID=3155605 RepID=UPI0033C05298
MRTSVRHWVARAGGVTAAALLVAGTTAGATHATEEQSRNIRITAHFAATVAENPDTVNCGGFDVTAQGTAAGAPLGGKGTWQDEETACTRTLPGKYDINGTAVVVDTDGDRLTLAYHLTAPLSEDPVVHPSGTFQVTGGTGDYANATGSGTMNAVVNLKDTSHVSARLHGSLS